MQFVSINQLRIIADAEVRALGGVSKAARALGIAQPALTRFLRNIRRKDGSRSGPPTRLLKALGYREKTIYEKA